MRYSIQYIESDVDGNNYRITDNNTDSRVATCYVKANAELVCEALNALEESRRSIANILNVNDKKS